MQMSSAPQAGRAPGQRSLGLVFMIVFIDLLGFAIILPLLPRYAERFHASNAVIGLLFAAFSGMQFIFAPLWGRLSDRYGRRPALLAGLLGSVAFYSLFGAATIVESLTLMFVARIGAGICGATISAAQAYIADVTGTRDRARGMALIGAAFGLGFTFGPILGSIALPHTAVAAGQPEPLNALPGFLAAGLSAIAFLVALARLPESLHLNRGISDFKSQISDLQGVTSETPVLHQASRTPESTHRHTRHTWLDLNALRQAVSVPSIVPLLFLFFLSTFAFGQLETTLSSLTHRVFALDDRSNFYFFTYIGLTLSVIQGGLVRQLAPRLGESAMVTLGTILMIAGLWLVNLAAEHHSMQALIAIMPIVICGFSFVTTCVQSLVSRRSDPAQQGGILGLSQSAAAMARVLSPITGYLLFGLSSRLPYEVSAVLLVPAFVLALLANNSGRDWTPTAPPVEVEAE